MIKNKIKLKYFKKSEFTCKCGCGKNIINDDLLFQLDRARGFAGIPFKISSGYRCENHPESKKNPTSSHITGLAADIECKDSNTRAIMMDALVYAEFERYGLHKSFIHVDIDYTRKPSPAIWLY
jgi:zinc D-Ala-D-Ala carboxypeptidase|tara:strand:- start:118 stop:489 length:372 start_codon:yes stop_codon:yes gene_type:complete